MVDTHFKSKQNQFLHLDTKKILSAPPYILLDFDNTLLRYKPEGHNCQVLTINDN